MKADSLLAALLLCATSAWLPLSAAETELLKLENNPFTRPPVQKPRPVNTRPVATKSVEPVELELTATMMSDYQPMVIVEGELIGIGDSIKGMKLVEVMDGKAVFSIAGKNKTYEIVPDIK